jgi:hypothetical protein
LREEIWIDRPQPEATIAGTKAWIIRTAARVLTAKLSAQSCTLFSNQSAFLPPTGAPTIVHQDVDTTHDLDHSRHRRRGTGLRGQVAHRHLRVTATFGY